MIVYECRASTILYNLMAVCRLPGPVLLPANVCPIVPITLHKAGRRFEFVDISPITLSMDHEKVLERWSAAKERPAGLVYVRSFGAVFDTVALFREIKRLAPEACIIDDRCICAPSFDSGNLLDNVDAVLYSTGYAKYVDIGFGGYAILKDDICYRGAELAYDQRDLEALTIQYKKSLSERQKFLYTNSDWLDSSMPRMEWSAYRKMVEAHALQASEIKREINYIYSSRLPRSIQLPSAFQSWRFNIHVANKDMILNVIQESGLFASGHYEALDGLFGDGSGANARMLHRHIINLFNDGYFDSEKAKCLADVIVNSNNFAQSPLEI